MAGELISKNTLFNAISEERFRFRRLIYVLNTPEAQVLPRDVSESISRNISNDFRMISSETMRRFNNLSYSGYVEW